jgi:hypothetical protein
LLEEGLIEEKDGKIYHYINTQPGYHPERSRPPVLVGVFIQDKEIILETV